tara:strand:- start:112 stop:288 length:177 start_codon:yes stop_codon:yes gene_type:complete
MWYLIIGLLILVSFLIWIYYIAHILLWFWAFLKEIPQGQSQEDLLKDRNFEENSSFEE